MTDAIGRRARARGWRVVAMVCLAGLLRVAAADPATAPMPVTDLSARVDVLEAQASSEADWQALLAALEAQADPHLLARAQRIRCEKQIESAPEQAREHAAQGLAVVAASDAEERAALLLCRGYLAEAAGDNAAAMQDYEAAVAVARAGEPGKALAQGLTLRGEQRYLRGDYAAALEDLQAAYALYQRQGNLSRENYTLTDIANVYADRHVAQYDQALDYYARIEARHRAADNRAELATVHFNIASTLERAGRAQAAIPRFREALAEYRALDDARSVAETQRALAATLLQVGAVEQALAELPPARAYAESNGDLDLAARVALTEGSALRRAGQPAAALERLDAARRHFVATDSPRYLETIEDERASALAAAGRWREAHDARRAQLDHAARLATQLREEQTAQMRVRFDSERKDEENRALLRENALRAQALLDAGQIRRLQTALIALASLLILLLAGVAITALRRAKRMRRLALTDELTALPNRRSILATLQAACRPASTAAGVLLLDIDHFKSINDRLGHEVGDLVLRRSAAVAREALGRAGELGRIGGEEFLAVLRGDPATLMAAAERIRARLAATDFSADAPGLAVTVSVGVTACRSSDARIEAAIQRADAALYRAKAAGRNRVVWADAEGPAETSAG